MCGDMFPLGSGWAYNRVFYSTPALIEYSTARYPAVRSFAARRGESKRILASHLQYIGEMSKNYQNYRNGYRNAPGF